MVCRFSLSFCHCCICPSQFPSSKHAHWYPQSLHTPPVIHFQTYPVFVCHSHFTCIQIFVISHISSYFVTNISHVSSYFVTHISHVSSDFVTHIAHVSSYFVTHISKRFIFTFIYFSSRCCTCC